MSMECLRTLSQETLRGDRRGACKTPEFWESSVSGDPTGESSAGLSISRFQQKLSPPPRVAVLETQRPNSWLHAGAHLHVRGRTQRDTSRRMQPATQEKLGHSLGEEKKKKRQQHTPKVEALTSVRDCSLLFISQIRYSGCTIQGVCLLQNGPKGEEQKGSCGVLDILPACRKSSQTEYQ